MDESLRQLDKAMPNSAQRSAPASTCAKLHSNFLILMFFVVATIFSRTPALAGGARENAKFSSFFATLPALGRRHTCGFA
jgi:hypothetical protein